MTELESEIKKDIQQQQHLEKAINKSQFLEQEPAEPPKVNYWQKIKKWLANMKNQTINYLECDQLLDSEQDDTQPLFSGGYKKKFAENFYDSYSERQTKFAYTYQQVLQQREKQQQRKSKNFWIEFKRLICCQGGNQMDQLDELYIQKKQKMKFKKDPQYALNETKQAFFEMNSNRSDKENKKQRKMIKMRKVEQFQMEDNLVVDMDEFQFQTPGQNKQTSNRNKNTIITSKQEKIENKNIQKMKETQLNKIHVRQKKDYSLAQKPIEETKEDLVFNDNETLPNESKLNEQQIAKKKKKKNNKLTAISKLDEQLDIQQPIKETKEELAINDNSAIPNESKVNEQQIAKKKKKKNSKLTAISKLDEQVDEVNLQFHEKQQELHNNKVTQEENEKQPNFEQKNYETLPIKQKKRKTKKIQELHNEDMNGFEIQINQETKQQQTRQFHNSNSLEGDQLQNRYQTYNLKKQNAASQDFIKQKQPIDIKRGQKKKRRKMLEVKKMKQETADLQLIDFDQMQDL